MSQLKRLMAQYQTFDTVTLPCDRCEEQRPLAYLQPVANLSVGFVCRLCLQSMSLDEFRLLAPRPGPYHGDPGDEHR